MKEIYQAPSCKVELFPKEDIVCASFSNDDDGLISDPFVTNA